LKSLESQSLQKSQTAECNISFGKCEESSLHIGGVGAKRELAHMLITKGANTAGGQLHHLWLISMDMAPSHIIFEQIKLFLMQCTYCIYKHAAEFETKNNSKTRKYILYLRINGH